MKKTIFAAILLVLSLTAFSATEPIGFQDMLNTLSRVSHPKESLGLVFELKKSPEFKNINLTLTPADAFTIKNLNNNSILVSVNNVTSIYDMELYANTSIIVLKEIGFIWTEEGTGEVKTDDVGFQSCSINVGFLFNKKVITQTNLDYFVKNNYSVNLNFNNSILEKVGSTETETIFKRKNNNDTSVSLVILKPDGSLLFRSVVNNLDKCVQTSTTSTPPTTTSKNANDYLSVVMRNATWRKVVFTNATYEALYTWTYQNTHPTKSLFCIAHINGVSILDSQVLGVHDTDNHEFILHPKDHITLSGELNVKLKVVGSHTGIRDQFWCHFK